MTAREEDVEDEDEDEEPVKKRPRRGMVESSAKKIEKHSTILQPFPQTASESRVSEKTVGDVKPKTLTTKKMSSSEDEVSLKGLGSKCAATDTKDVKDVNAIQMSETGGKDDASDMEEDKDSNDDEDEKPEIAAKTREKVQSTLKGSGKDPYPDWKAEEPVPYAALCTTFSLIELTTKRLIISAHCSLFLRQVLRLTPEDLLPTIQLMVNKLAADYAGIELGIGESLIMKAIGETTGRSLAIIKADQNEIGDLGLVAAKSRSNQPTMFKPKALTVRGVLNGLMGIATVQGDGSQGRKIAGIKKLLSAADAVLAGKGNKGVDITKDKGGASEAKFIVRFLEGKLRLGLAEKTVLVALAHAMVIHEIEKTGNKLPSSEQLSKGEAILKTVYRRVEAS